MIAYEELVMALSAWRERNGLPVGAADYLGEPPAPRPVSFASYEASPEEVELGEDVLSAEDAIIGEREELLDDVAHLEPLDAGSGASFEDGSFEGGSDAGMDGPTLVGMGDAVAGLDAEVAIETAEDAIIDETPIDMGASAPGNEDETAPVDIDPVDMYPAIDDEDDVDVGGEEVGNVAFISSAPPGGDDLPPEDATDVHNVAPPAPGGYRDDQTVDQKDDPVGPSGEAEDPSLYEPIDEESS